MTHRRHGGERGKEQSQHGRRQAKASAMMTCGVILWHGGPASEDCPGIFVERDGAALFRLPECHPDRAATRPPRVSHVLLAVGPQPPPQASATRGRN